MPRKITPKRFNSNTARIHRRLAVEYENYHSHGEDFYALVAAFTNVVSTECDHDIDGVIDAMLQMLRSIDNR